MLTKRGLRHGHRVVDAWVQQVVLPAPDGCTICAGVILIEKAATQDEDRGGVCTPTNDLKRHMNRVWPEYSTLQ